jgi:hypothetical protein
VTSVESAGPLEGPADPARVARWLNPDATGEPPEALVDVVAATNAVVRRWLPVPTDGVWPADVELGTRMLAGRLYSRRLSPQGVLEGLSAEGGVYVRRNDPDVALLLRLGDYAPPRVG